MVSEFFDKIACEGKNINAKSVGFSTPFGLSQKIAVNLKI